MNDPKYKFGNDDLIFHRIGEYFIDSSEPVMLLRGKDVTALYACMEYVKVLLEMEPNEAVNSHIDSSIERLKTFYLYQTQNPNISGIGCSQKHHSGSEEIIKDAEKLLKELRII